MKMPAHIIWVLLCQRVVFCSANTWCLHFTFRMAKLKTGAGGFARYQQPEAIIDMGCGLGFYVSLLRARGLSCDGPGAWYL